MITCKECLERMYPDDPGVKSGRYHLCSCDYCGKPDIDREIEKLLEIKPPIEQPEWTRKQWDAIQQLRSEVAGWREKHAESLLAIDKLAQQLQKPKSQSRHG